MNTRTHRSNPAYTGMPIRTRRPYDGFYQCALIRNRQHRVVLCAIHTHEQRTVDTRLAIITAFNGCLLNAFAANTKCGSLLSVSALPSFAIVSVECTTTTSVDAHTHTSTPTQLAKDKKINERVLCAAANTISYLMSFSLSLILFTHTPFHRLLLHFRVLRLVYLSIRTTRVYNYWRYSPSSSIFISIVKALYVLVDARTRRHSTGKN